MRRLLTILGFLLITSPGWATWTLTQVKDATGCSGTTCAVTVTSTGSGHLLVAGLITGNTAADAITGVTAGACSGAWVHCTNCSLGVSGDGSVDFSYCLSSVSGQTSITITASSMSGGIGVIWEANSSLGSIALDSGATPSGTKNDTVGCTACAGVALTLSGNNNFVAALSACGGTCSGLVGTGFTNDLLNPGNDGVAHGITTGSLTAPTTWTQTSGTLIGAAIAFKEAAGAAAACQYRALMGVGC